MLSNKQGIRNLIEICAAKGIEQIIISPGSRNAPLNISFNEDGRFKCLSIADERVAGFFGLGIAQQTRIPVVLCCTSGSAALNFAPAIVEAYYQKIPLLILTADRPVAWVDQGDGQTIRQRDIFQNYILKSYELIEEAASVDALWSNDRMVCEAIDSSLQNGGGPVHINIPLAEPLYDQKDYKDSPLPKIIHHNRPKKILDANTIQEMAMEWEAYDKKIILCGLMPRCERLQKAMSNLLADPSVVILTETSANLFHAEFNPCIDRLITTIQEDELESYLPNFLVTIGGAIVSKKIKALIRKHPPKAHWHISDQKNHLDTFQSLTRKVEMEAVDFWEQMANQTKPVPSHFRQRWNKKDQENKSLHAQFLATCDWSDLKAFDCILEKIPKGSDLQMGNSSPVRYIQLFDQREDLIYHSNRGASGIDGCTSTAAGAAYAHGRPTTVITGDIAFFYDSNAFWNKHLTSNLKVILINNGGGGIFRIIPGPATTNQLETFFETEHELNARYIAKTFGISYYFAEEEETLREILPEFYKEQVGGQAAILEIKTPQLKNNEVLKAYFDRIKQ